MGEVTCRPGRIRARERTMDELRGLTAAEVVQRRAWYGANALPETRYGLPRLILRQFRGVFNVLLLAAAGVTFALGEPIDASFILLFVFLGTTLNVIQEYKANAASDRLKSYLVRTITVRRDGRDQEVSTEEIVPGDLLRLESGDIVPADAVARRGDACAARPSARAIARAARATRSRGRGRGPEGPDRR